MDTLALFKKYWKRQKNFRKLKKREILEMISKEPSIVLKQIFVQDK